MRYHVRVRRFLNRIGHEAGAYVIAEVPDSASCGKNCEHGPWDDCREFVLSLSDGSRVVTLEFSVRTSKDRQNSLHKIETLVDVLGRFRDAFVIEADRAASGG